MYEYPDKPVPYSEMRRNLWIAFKWENVQEHGDIMPIYVCSGMRPIEDTETAARQFDTCWRNITTFADVTSER